ncbi:type I-C CRISPR-associated endonuclease Cas1c [Aminobacterium mobile]|uniref:type I-C CRISPR-associated endonuclease Cas1c n=1 Tax=Aminobacterium mobile TaxID=81467 RepID=UPI003314C144
MKHLLNTLYITSQGSYLSKQGNTILVKIEDEVRFRIPIHNLQGIVCFGRVMCSPYLMELCGERNIPISFLSENGKFYARLQGPVSGNVLLRREQYRRADDAVSSGEIAKSIVAIKILNSRNVLLRALRDHKGVVSQGEIEEVVKHMAELVKRLQNEIDIDVIRGIEGDAARSYFSVFNSLITSQKDDFTFYERSRRPPLDRVNSLLSFLYTLLAHDVASALEEVGLDPAVGFLHRDRPGRRGLALDLMEEFRSFIADRLTLSLINRKQVKGRGLKKLETGAFLMDDDTRKKVLVAYQEKKQEQIQHPFIGEKVSLGLLPHIQASLLARHLRGDLDGYPPFRWK